MREFVGFATIATAVALLVLAWWLAGLVGASGWLYVLLGPAFFAVLAIAALWLGVMVFPTVFGAVAGLYEGLRSSWRGLEPTTATVDRFRDFTVANVRARADDLDARSVDPRFRASARGRSVRTGCAALAAPRAGDAASGRMDRR